MQRASARWLAFRAAAGLEARAELRVRRSGAAGISVGAPIGAALGAIAGVMSVP